MVYKAPKSPFDDIKGPLHNPITRRQLIQRGLATGTLALALPRGFHESYFKQAQAAGTASSCPPSSTNPGSAAFLYMSGGGCTNSAYILDDQTVANMNVAIAKNYGVTPANIKKYGSNFNIDVSSTVGIILNTGPLGFNTTTWQTKVLTNVSCGHIVGVSNQDDGAGNDLGYNAGIGTLKASQMNEDIRINFKSGVASYAQSLPAAKVAVSPTNLTSASLAGVFTSTPASTGFTNPTEMANIGIAVPNIISAFNGPAGLGRRGMASILNAATCEMPNNTSIVNPTYGSRLFTATGISALTGLANVAGLTPELQALAAAHYQSAMGVAGGVAMEMPGADYHPGASIQDVIAYDTAVANYINMWLLGCVAAGQSGTLQLYTNGFAGSNGTQAQTGTFNGQNISFNTSVPVGDKGGFHSSMMTLFYNAKGAGPVTKTLGTVDFTDGSTKASPNVPTVPDAVAGNVYSSLLFLSGGTTVPAKALSAIQASGVGLNPNNLMVIS